MVKSKYLFSLVALTLFSLLSINLFGTEKSQALSGSSFNAGKIITDSVFFRGDAMSVSQIQSFLNAKVPTCDTNHAKTSSSNDSGPPYTCLKSYRQNTPSRPSETALCSALGAKSNQTAAQIIYSVGKACGVSQKSIIVLLQKEQSLITDTWPWDIQYRSATGYGCPDTAPCSSEYYGFFNQVYKAAWQFKKYARDTDNYSHKAGLYNNIRYNPNAACKTKSVLIQNQATAGLYNYTPYTPNKPALDNLYGTGNSCSAYGNRNFWRIYNDWFGSTLKQESFSFIICDNQKYLVEQNYSKKRLLTSSAVSSWKLSEGDFLVNGIGCEYPGYSIAVNTLIKSRSSNKVYLVDRGKAYHVASQEVASAWGLGSLGQTLPYVDSETIKNNLSLVGTLPRLAKSTNTSVKNIYLIDGGNRYTIAGTPTDETSSLRLIRGDNEVPMATFSVDLLQSLDSEGTLDYSFKVGSNWYLLDYNKTKQIFSSANIKWGGFLSGPTLSVGALSIFDKNTVLGSSFNRGSYFYRLLDNSTFQRTQSRQVAKNWGILDSATITILLTNKLIADTTYANILGVEGNIRFIQCGSSKYLVERYISSKRLIGTNAIKEWGFDDKYALLNDRACTYRTYALEAEQLIRSRDTGKVYYVEDQKAYHVHSQQAANEWGFGNISTQTFPLFDGASINDNLTVVKQLPPYSP